MGLPVIRYITLPQRQKAYDDWESQPPIGQATTVYEPDDAPVDTGIVDASGTKLYRVRDRTKMGFL